MTQTPRLGLVAVSVVVIACGSEAPATHDQAAPTTTRLSKTVTPRNLEGLAGGVQERWEALEKLRIGKLEGEGPEVFGRIPSLEVDVGGRLWVLEGHAQEVRVFDSLGNHLRTVGGRGRGPGRFLQAVQIERGPDERMWVVDPQNARVSVFDTSGVLVKSHRVPGGFLISPWPGRFDERGHYYAPILLPGNRTHFAIVRSSLIFELGLGQREEPAPTPSSDLLFGTADTLFMPRDPVDREFFEHSPGPGRRLRAGVPLQGGFRWRISSAGTFVALLTDEYRLFELTQEGDTLWTTSRRFTRLPVTEADLEYAHDRLEWFTREGGRFDAAKLPRTKPPTRNFFLDSEGHIWVELVPEDAGDTGLRWEVFGPDGRYLAHLVLPFNLSSAPPPIVRNGMLYGVTTDELGTPYVVRARIIRPRTDMNQ